MLLQPSNINSQLCFYTDQTQLHNMLLQRSRTDTQHAFTTIKNGYTPCFYNDQERIHNMLLQRSRTDTQHAFTKRPSDIKPKPDDRTRDHLISNPDDRTRDHLISNQTPMTGQETT